MILEAMQFAASWALSGRRVRSEIAASVSLWARARRCRAAWASHEANCHRAVSDAIDRLSARDTVIVLGSGLLRDVPAQLLASRFRRVVLVDLQHLATVRLWCQLKGLSNLSFIQADLSGLDDPGGNPLAVLDAIGPADLVISANLASQIGVGVSRILAGRRDVDAEAVAAGCVAAHFAALARARSPVLVLTDTTYRVIDKAGRMIEDGDLLGGADPGPADQTWDWLLAPIGEADPDYHIIHRAMARLVIPPLPPPAGG